MWRFQSLRIITKSFMKQNKMQRKFKMIKPSLIWISCHHLMLPWTSKKKLLKKFKNSMILRRITIIFWRSQERREAKLLLHMNWSKVNQASSFIQKNRGQKIINRQYFSNQAIKMALQMIIRAIKWYQLNKYKIKAHLR